MMSVTVTIARTMSRANNAGSLPEVLGMFCIMKIYEAGDAAVKEGRSGQESE